MRRPTQAELVSTLQKHGYHFRTFQSAVEDPCRVDDVEWNYKDIVHPHFVHPHMTRCYTFADADGYSCVDLQRIFGFQIPQSVSVWVSGPDRMTLQTTTLSLIILIEVVYEAIGDIQTRTTTTYQLGSASRLLLAVAFPVFRWALKRNWNEFWRDDHRMRVRRGELRQQGFDFAKPPAIYGIASTLKISDNNVVLPKGVRAHGTTTIDLADRKGQVVHVGNSDHFGLQLVLREEQIEVYPRLCPHEGACLDTPRAPTQATVQCPWHGRAFPPIVTLRYAQAPTTVVGPLHRFVLAESTLRIEPLGEPDAPMPTEWSSARLQPVPL